MSARAWMFTGVVLAMTVAALPARPARAACATSAILGSAKSALQAATEMRVVTGIDSEKQYQLLLQARSSLNAAPNRIATECADDGFNGMVTRETNTVYRAWNDALSSGRALFLAGQRRDCAPSLRTVASASVTNGWGLLNRLFRERPHPDSYATAHDMLLARARELGFALPPLGDSDALYTLEHKNHWDAFSAGAFLPPYCTRY